MGQSSRSDHLDAGMGQTSSTLGGLAQRNASRCTLSTNSIVDERNMTKFQRIRRSIGVDVQPSEVRWQFDWLSLCIRKTEDKTTAACSPQ
jgi:hypothetical protein